MLTFSLLTSSTHHLIQVQSALHTHSLTGCKHLYPQRKNHHGPLQKTDWQTSISITLFKPFYTHLMCHSFHSSSKTSPILLNRWNIYSSIKRTDEIPSQTWLQPTFPPTGNHTSPETKHFYPKMLPPSRQTNLNAFHSYLHTTQLSAPSHALLTKTSAFQPHPIAATTYSSLHLLLPSDAATTSATFLLELNYATNHKTTYSLEALFNAASILLRAPKYPTGLLQLWKLYLHDSLQMLSQSNRGESKRRLKDCFNERHRPFDKPTNVFKPTMTCHSFH